MQKNYCGRKVIYRKLKYLIDKKRKTKRNVSN